jgi:hypothetical protein
VTGFFQEMINLQAKHLGFDERQVGRAKPRKQIT